MPFKWMPAQGNLLTLCGEAALTITPALDAATPAAQMCDGRPSTPVRFGTAAAGSQITVTLNLLRNPGFELGTSDWIVLRGSSEITTNPEDVGEGIAALEITTEEEDDLGVRYQDVRIPAGIPFELSALLRGTGFDGAFVVLQNLDTGRFLDSSGAWVADATVRALASVDATYADVEVSGTVETFSQTGRYLTRLRVQVSADAAGCFIDEVAVRPAWNFVALIGHNLTGRGEFRDPGTPGSYYGQVPWLEFQSEDTVRFEWLVPDEGADELADGAAFPIRSPTTWRVWGGAPWRTPTLTITISSDQYGSYPIPTFGELVVGYVEDLLPAAFPFALKLSEAGQVRNETAAGDAYVYNPGPNALRELTLRWTYVGDAAEHVLRDRLYRVSRGGADGIILVPPAGPPTDLVAGVGCIFGLPEADFGYSIEAPTTGPELIRTASLVIRELPSPETAAP
jgi:hypothetical protein